LGFLTAAATLQGAAISWGPATDIASDSDVRTAGTAVYAYAWSGIASTVNGVSFAGSPGINGGTNVLAPAFSNYGPALFTSKAAPFSALSTAYSNILIGADYVLGLPVPVTLKNLAIGHNYTVQVWANDPRGLRNARSETITSAGGNTNTLRLSINYTNTNPGGPGQYIIGNFTADATDQTFILNAGTNATQMNALQLRDMTLFSDANWVSMGGITGADGSLSATAVDGSGNLYIGGSFTVVGGVIANGIAKWDGTNWSALGSGMNGWVGQLAVSGNNVYAAGGFTMAGGKAANYIAKWDGTNWSALGSGLSGDVYALAVSGSNLYAAGLSTTASHTVANYIVKWDGSAWSALGSGMEMECSTFPPPCPPPMVSALAVSGTNLYAGGRFNIAGGVSATNIAKWDGNAWSALGSGMSGSVHALAVSGSNLYAGGGDGGPKAANYIAKWDGSTWSALGSGVDYSVYALAVSGTDVYAGGEFATAGGTPASYIARWDGNSWSALGPGVDSYVYALAVSGSNLCAGGLFKRAGATSLNYIAKWDGSNWSAIGSGMNGNGVLALAGSSSNLYAVGSFTFGGGGGVASSYVAKWDGGSWNALGSGMNGEVSALVVSGTNLYVGGSFTTAGGVSATNIAKWDGSSWSALGSGMSGGVYLGSGVNAGVSALVVLGSDLYAGGNFTAAGGVSAINIAKWDGSSWSALGSGLGSGTTGDRVFALAAWGGNLYAGGWFTNAGGVSATYIAKWDGSSWSAVGSGLNAGVGVLSGSSGDLYAASGISFLGGPAGGIPTNNYIARWNGSSWSTTPGLVSDNRLVTALALSGSDLYAGGWFTSAGGVSASYIAKWDGTNWSALGSGMNGGVSALLMSGGDLYAGGSFTIAGGKVSGYIAHAHLFSIPALSVDRLGNAVMVSWPSIDAAGFALQQADKLAPPISWVPITVGITDVGTNKSVTLPATNSQQFFRLQSP
jgi:hypothetical protein